jgi:hypothetical protein
MILIHWTLLLVPALFVQLLDDALTGAEKAQLQKEQKLDNRIKIYDRASIRMSKTLEALAIREDFEPVPAALEKWTALLSLAARDIQEHASRKKKSKALIRYEIGLRRALSDVQSYKIRAPVDQQDTFDSFLKHAEAIRKSFVDILFPG